MRLKIHLLLRLSSVFRSVHDQVSRSGWEIRLGPAAECSFRRKVAPKTSPNCAPKGLQFVLSASLYSIDNKGSPSLTTRPLDERL